jgi:hypothetical protein
MLQVSVLRVLKVAYATVPPAGGKVLQSRRDWPPKEASNASFAH